MKKTKAVSLLLSLSMMASLVMPSASIVPTYAAEKKDNGMEVLKTAEPVEDEEGVYTIKLEAYATGSSVMTEVKNVDPTDVVLVLDQSGSMDDRRYTMSTYDFKAYSRKTNKDYYELRYNGGQNNLYYKRSDGSYVSVSVTMTLNNEDSLEECPDQWRNTDYYKNRGNLYAVTDSGYGLVNVTTQRSFEGTIYVYKFPDGSVVSSVGGWNSPRNFENKGPLFLYSGDITYEYTYRENSEVKHIETSTGQNIEPGVVFYEKYRSGSIRRITALKNAVTQFVESVREKAAGVDGEFGTDDDVEHRVAVVGFASDAVNYNEHEFENTEVFVGANQYKYNSTAAEHYQEALMDMRDANKYSKIKDSINALTGYGATYPEYGLEMAKGILDANSGTQKRNRVVILFTDGAPGAYSNNFSTTAANNAIDKAKELKNAKVTVYSVGIFDGADATSAGSQNGNNKEKANWFMQSVSSNNGEVKEDAGYYLSAADADTLNNIFAQISNWIQNGGTSSTLTEKSVVKDIVSEQFTLPEDADEGDITLETYKCTGKNAKGEYTWEKNPDAMGACVITPVERDQVSVSGFNFSENYVGTFTDKNGNISYRGNKLVIKFNVKPKAGMLGGNQVFTNDGAGIYEDASAKEPVIRFNRPTVDVPIPKIDVKAQDKNVYLKGEVTADELKSGAVIKAGNSVTLDLSKENYGLESWQNEYVDIKVKITDKDNKDVTGKIADLTDDSTYNVIVTISPKYAGPVTAESGTGTANINVFKPELTYKDSSAYYGETAATEFTDNKATEIWKHGDTKDIDEGVIVLGTKPALTLSYEPKSGTIVDGKYTKKDVPVKVKVEIGTEDVTAKTTFKHQDCTDTECKWSNPDTPGDPAFMIHIKTCDLTVKKSGGAAGEPYAFTVYKDGVKYSEVTVTGNGSEKISELPVGTYTIKEDEGWSWRYRANIGNAVTLQATSPTGEIECINTKKTDQWLNGFSDVVTNIFGKPHTQKGGKN